MPYDKQDRGTNSAYDRYLAAMDGSMRQKVALTAAHLLCEGDVADMGMGSGSGSFALASLYPSLRVTGVDVNPEMVARAREIYPLPNLAFQIGDIATPCLPPGTQEAILDSSVLHHVTSFNGYDRSAASRALAVQVEALSPGGVLVVRDFLDPGPQPVWLDLPAGPLVDLFLRFSREFRSLSATPGCTYEERPAPAGWRRFELTATLAAEFVLRKDYLDDWELEIQEEYLYLTQEDFERLFSRLGLRVLASNPIWNPWIVRNRFEGQFVLRDTSGNEIDPPATNYVIVGQKAPAGEGVRIVEERTVEPRGYLEMTHFRRTDTGKVLDLVRRPGTTVDVVPWFVQEGALFVLGRRSYPRPIVACRPAGTVAVDGCHPSQYLTEPLNVQQGDKPLAQTAEELLADHPAIGREGIRRFERGVAFYPSPGGLQEEIRSILVEIEPTRVDERVTNVSGFSTSGVLRAIEGRQLLRAAQVGGLPEARLELNVYELLLRQGRDPGEWIGEAIDLAEVTPHEFAPVALDALLSAEPRRRFRPHPEPAGFLDLLAAELVEHDAQGAEVARRCLERVVPRALSINTLAVAALMRTADGDFLGVDDDDLPAAQCFTGNSRLLVTPAWRLPKDVVGIRRSRSWVVERLEREYGVRTGRVWELGGRYHPSPGVTPEVVVPLAVEVTGPGRLHWVRLPELIDRREDLSDGHLRLAACRAAHALGVMARQKFPLPAKPRTI